MNATEVRSVPIAEIKIINPRTRNKVTFAAIVANIAAVGLKTPITVSMRDLTPDGTRYDLVCGQGRLEAFLELGETSIPAIVGTASREDQFLMSLIENIARRPTSELGLIREIKSLLKRNYRADEIGRKLGMSRSYISTIVSLLEHGEARLVAMVESSKIPITVATQIATGTTQDVQRALTEAYERGDLRGPKLAAARQIIRRRQDSEERHASSAKPRAPLTSRGAILEYRRQTHAQRALIRRANIVRERLILIASASRQLLADENFVTLLKAEGLSSLSEIMIEKTQEF
jgi:ParB family transcriptional regulator, chromosome partitioning protein